MNLVKCQKTIYEKTNELPKSFEDVLENLSANYKQKV